MALAKVAAAMGTRAAEALPLALEAVLAAAQKKEHRNRKMYDAGRKVWLMP